MPSKIATEELTLERLRMLLVYDPETGLFISLVARPPWRIGQVVGYRRQDDYTRITIDYRSYKAHRLALFYMTGEWPEPECDHRNGIRSDDRWENLRAATRSQNARNTKIQSNNTSGYRGISWSRDRGKWIAMLCGKRIGRFSTKEAAIAARHIAEIEAFGEFRRV